MRVVKEPEERKQEILETAIRVFARKGYDKTSISDIAKEMNISQGLCYRYFASKEEIYDAAVQMYAEEIVTKHTEKWKSGHGTMQQMIANYFDVMDDYEKVERENPELYAIFHDGRSNKKMHDQLMLAVANKSIPHVMKIFEAAKEQGELQIEDAYATVHFIVFGQVGILMNEDIPKNKKNQMIRNVLMEFMYGIKKS